MPHLPTVNAVFNVMATVLLVTGYLFIRRDRRDLHRLCMIGALVCSLLFLVFYLIHHYQAGTTRFTGTGTVRLIYFIILWTHTPLAALNVPLVIMTVRRAFKGQHDRHRRIARWTLPIWLYVSVTGILVYLMLYQWYPAQP